MLQVAGRANQVKHKALLMSAKPPTDQFAKPEFIDESTLLPGDAFERMCLDPELMHTRKQLKMGAVAVCVLSLVAAGVQFRQFLPWPKPDASETAIVKPASLASVPLIPQPRMTAEALKRINFRPARHEEGQGAVSDAMQAVLEKFLNAASVDEKIAFVHDSVRLAPAMRSYYQRHQTGALAHSHIERYPGSGGYFTEFRVVLRDGTKKFAAVVSTPEGPRVDWASFVALGDLEWEQMRQVRPVSPVLMRVLAAKGNQFTGVFSNAEKLRCIRLVSAADPSATPVYGYVPLESELGRQFGEWLNSSNADALPLTVKVCYPQEVTAHDQVWISEVVAPSWVTANVKSSNEGQ
jgi:hypothetical protein